jgi:hypothetical protein
MESHGEGRELLVYLPKVIDVRTIIPTGLSSTSTSFYGNQLIGPTDAQ